MNKLIFTTLLVSSLGFSTLALSENLSTQTENAKAFYAIFDNYSSNYQGSDLMTVYPKPLNGSEIICKGNCQLLAPSGGLVLYVSNSNGAPAADVSFMYMILNLNCPHQFTYTKVNYHLVGKSNEPIRVFDENQNISPNTVTFKTICP